MIATLTGKIAEKLGEMVVLEVNGVGYGVLMSAGDSEKLNVSEEKKLYIYEYLREDSHDLYGFSALATKNFFEQLLSVNGVGPRMALHILSIGTVAEVAGAIASGDTKFIQLAHGVGKRVAERIVVDLKDKVGLAASGDLVSILTSGAATQDEAVQALLSLGLTQADALNALSKIDRKLPTEDRVKQALKGNLQ